MYLNQLQKNALIKQLEDMLQAVKDMPAKKDCISCYYFDRSGMIGVCKKYDAAPPDDIKAVGCESYIFDPMTPPF